MFVCICYAITDKDIRAAVAKGAESVGEVGKICGAGTECGSCCQRVMQLIENEQRVKNKRINPQSSFSLARELA